MNITNTFITIHNALYSDQRVVTLNNIDYPIQKTLTGCRYMDYHGIRIIQQSKYDQTEWAAKVKAGEKISWAIMHTGKTRIDDEFINSSKTST